MLTILCIWEVSITKKKTKIIKAIKMFLHSSLPEVTDPNDYSTHPIHSRGWAASKPRNDS